MDLSGRVGCPMKSAASLRFKTYVSILVMVIFGPVGNVLLSSGMKRIGPASNWATSGLLHVFTRVMSSGLIWLGIASLIAFFVSNILVLTWADYSYVLPASSVAYGIVALLGYFALGETVSVMRWVGVAIICLGVMIVGQTPPRTTNED